jgi:hypothetical protein
MGIDQSLPRERPELEEDDDEPVLMFPEDILLRESLLKLRPELSPVPFQRLLRLGAV